MGEEALKTLPVSWLVWIIILLVGVIGTLLSLGLRRVSKDQERREKRDEELVASMRAVKEALDNRPTRDEMKDYVDEHRKVCEATFAGLNRLLDLLNDRIES